MSGAVVYGSLLAIGVAVLQSTLLGFVRIAGVQPDLVLVVVLFMANKNGRMTGQLCGFVAGVALDLIGLAPLGFHALLYTLIGALYGVTRGKMFIDPLFMPLIMAVVAVAVKGLLALLVTGLFGLRPVAEVVFSGSFLLEIGYTALTAPVLFGLLGMFGWLQPDRRRGEFV